MQQPLYWTLRNRLTPGWRSLARRAVDTLAAYPLGSWRSTLSGVDVALTFDDGPEPDLTPRLLDLLDEYGAKCTFFMLVNQARTYPELAGLVAHRGHEVALHGQDHRRLTQLSHREARRYLTAARKELEDIVGVPVALYRPPYGSQSVPSYLAARRAGLSVVVWSADAADWVDRSSGEVAHTALDGLRPGGVLLLHERLEPDPLRDAPRTGFDRIEMVRTVLDGVRERGWGTDTVGSLASRDGLNRSVWFRP